MGLSEHCGEEMGDLSPNRGYLLSLRQDIAKGRQYVGERTRTRIGIFERRIESN